MDVVRATILTVFLPPYQSIYVIQNGALMVFEWPTHTPTFSFISVCILDTQEERIAEPLHRSKAYVITE